MKEYQFNDCGICTNADEVFLLCESNEHPYKGNYAVVAYAQLPDGTFKTGITYWFFEGGYGCGVSNKYGKAYKTKEDAIADAGEFCIRALQKITHTHNESGEQTKVNTQKLINTIRENIDKLTQPTLF